MSLVSVRHARVQTYDAWVANLTSNNLLINVLLSDYGFTTETTETVFQMDSIVNYLGKKLNTRITIIDGEGVVLVDSKEDALIMDNHISRPEIVAATEYGQGYSLRHSDTLNEKFLFVALAVYDSTGNIKGFIRTSRFLRDIQEGLNQLYMQILGSAVFLVLVSLLLFYVIARNLTVRIRSILDFTTNIKNKNFSFRVLPKKSDEIGLLGKRVNEMAVELENFFLKIEAEKNYIEAVVSFMLEGLVVFDKNDEVRISNKKFNEIFSLENSPRGMKFTKITDNMHFYEAVMTAKRDGIVKNVEMETIDNFYIINGVKISDSRDERIILVFHDVSEAKKLEKIKSDFVANVAHELKTPLTSIKGFAETIEDELGEQHNRFITIIKRNADRLIHIVADLITLSRIESLEKSRQRLETEEFDLEFFLKNLVGIFEDNLKAKNIELVLTCQKDISMTSDPYMLEHVFVNLIDNAIKYNKDNGKINVTVTSRNSDFVKIQVADTGIGIKNSDIDRIFERFYVVDKSRSKLSGGTGLGLSIIKHIVNLLNGEIHVESKEGAGTVFTVVLPKVTSCEVKR